MEIGPRLITAAVFAVTLCSMITVPCSADEVNNPGNGLHVGFYDRKCPNLEEIVTDVVAKAVETDQKLPAGLIRLFFHDCFVKGCDASILLDSTPSNEPVEMQSPANGGIRGIEVIEEIKARLEQECPETVSCADILAFATREAVAFSGLPRHQVPAGRRDSRTSRASDVILPSPATPMDEIIDFFSRRNLTPEEMVVLFGAHSIGTVHCSFFDYRLYNFAPGQPQDPSLNPVFAADLAQQCPAPNTLQGEEAENKVVDLDTTPLVLDNHYYMNLIQGRALMQSDQALATNPRTGAEVAKLAIRSDSWARQFVRAIIKMGRINVLTGDAGEIRKIVGTLTNS
nr:peroxidase 5-like [Malus domestica]XP_028946727.1 peroxidase 5-like [Malus domestica]XP_028946728.1 peroxidase 5-like [Malus domestica]